MKIPNDNHEYFWLIILLITCFVGCGTCNYIADSEATKREKIKQDGKIDSLKLWWGTGQYRDTL